MRLQDLRVNRTTDAATLDYASKPGVNMKTMTRTEETGSASHASVLDVAAPSRDAEV